MYQGTYLGTLSQVNHLDLVGWINTARYKWAEMMGKEIKFRPATFYLGIADMLAREVEGQGKEEEHEEAREPSKAGAGVELEEGLKDTIIGQEQEADQQRTQMVESLDTAGADVHDKTSLLPGSSPKQEAKPLPVTRTFGRSDSPLS